MSKTTAAPVVTATANEVREVLRSLGETMPERGRISGKHIAQYNSHADEHDLPQYATADNGPRTAKVSYRARNNRTVTVEVETAKVREAAQAAGLNLGSKGRLSNAVKVAYAAGTLAEYAAAHNTVATLAVGAPPAPRKPRKTAKSETVETPQD